MSSIKEKMSVLKRIEINFDEEFVVQVTKNGATISEFIVSMSEIEYSLMSGKSRISVNIINPNSFVSQTTVTNIDYKE